MVRRLACLLVLCGSIASGKPLEDDAVLEAMSPQQVAAMVTVVDDPMEASVKISSEPVFQKREKGFLGKVLAEDTYLRARIDRQTGKVTYELVYWREHPGDWMMWDSANVVGPNGLVELKGYDAGHDVACGRYGCNFNESVAVAIPEDVIRLAGSPPYNDTWNYRIKGRYSDGDRDGFLWHSEVAGFLLAVDQQKPTK